MEDTDHGNGILIAIEGIDGAGKTTQVERLRHALASAGETVVSSKEPTDGKWGKIIRASAQNGRLDPDEELEAFIQDRQEHVVGKIRPALNRGEIVILDRYFYSTIAYQGARGNGVEKLSHDMRQQFPIPDIVVLVDAAPQITLDRISNSRGDIPNEFERLEYLETVRKIFLGMADSQPEIKVVDGHRSIDEVFLAIGHVLLNGVLKAKRCFKTYECDIFYCSYRINHECRWAEAYPKLATLAR